MAQFAPIPATVCPIAKLAGEIVRTIEALNRTDDAIVSAAPRQRFELEPRWTALSDRIAALEEAASHERAASPAGAVLQLMLVRDAVMALDGPDEISRQVDRLLVSVIGFLETAAGFAVPPATAGYYLPKGRDPFGLVSDALAGAEGSA